MKTKTERQLEAVSKWYVAKYGGFLFPTGFGKTYTAIQTVLRLKQDNLLEYGIIVIVPTIVLKEQWLKELAKFKVNANVMVINTASKLSNNYKCSLLIIDEAHSSLANTFINVFANVEHNYLLWLTATIVRTDNRHDLLLAEAPVCDAITLQECLDNKWVSDFMVYNLAVPFTLEELAEYRKADNVFRYYASLLGFSSFTTAKQWLTSGSSDQKAKAIIYYNSIRKRKNCITNNSNKAKVTIDIINKFPEDYTLVFSESIAFADSIKEQLSDICVSVHSKMSAKEQKEAFRLFKDGRTNKRVISSCKALTVGLDLPKLSLGIIASFNSSRLTNTQTIGRVIRPIESKQAKVINLVTPNTQEVNWLKKKIEGQINIKWIQSIEEII